MPPTRMQARWLAAEALRGNTAPLVAALDVAMANMDAAYLARHPEVRARRERLAGMSADERRAEVARLDGTLAREGRLLTADELQWRSELVNAR